MLLWGYFTCSAWVKWLFCPSHNLPVVTDYFFSPTDIYISTVGKESITIHTLLLIKAILKIFLNVPCWSLKPKMHSLDMSPAPSTGSSVLFNTDLWECSHLDAVSGRDDCLWSLKTLPAMQQIPHVTRQIPLIKYPINKIARVRFKGQWN